MRNRKNHTKLMPLARAIAVLSAVGIITTAVTFAALQSTGNALTGNTIETATASLQISTNGSTYSDSVPGFDFSGITPGGVAEPADNGGYLVMLKNTGDTSLHLRLTVTGTPLATGIADMSKVNVLVTPFVQGEGTFATQSIPLSSLIAGQVTLANATAMAKGAPVSLRLQVSMTADAIDGGGGSITKLDLTFSGLPL